MGLKYIHLLVGKSTTNYLFAKTQLPILVLYISTREFIQDSTGAPSGVIEHLKNKNISGRVNKVWNFIVVP